MHRSAGITPAGLVCSQQISKRSCGPGDRTDRPQRAVTKTARACEMQKHILNETDSERRHSQLATVPPFPMRAFCVAIALTMNWLNTHWDIFYKQRSAPSSVPLFITARVSLACLIFQRRQQGY